VLSTIESIRRDIAVIARTSEMRDQRAHYRRVPSRPPRRALSFRAQPRLSPCASSQHPTVLCQSRVRSSRREFFPRRRISRAAAAELMPRSRAERTRQEREREENAMKITESGGQRSTTPVTLSELIEAIAIAFISTSSSGRHHRGVTASSRYARVSV